MFSRMQNFIVLKDENMHPTFKTTWPYISEWLSDIFFTLDEHEFDEQELEDKNFIAAVAVKRSKRSLWLNSINKLVKLGAYICG